MPFATSTILLATSLAGMATTAYGTVKKSDAEKDMSAASRRAEDARREQARLNQMREQRKILRDRQAAQAIGLANLTNAGGDQGSSAYGGMLGQTGSAASQQQSDSAANYQVGERIFDANAAYADAQGRAATYGGVASLGKDIFAAAGPISRVGSTIFGGPGADHGTYGWEQNTYTRKA